MATIVRRAATVLVAVLCVLAAASRDTATQPLDGRFRSLQVYPEGRPLEPPIIGLGAPDRLVVSFDELDAPERQLRYRLTHCGADWQPDMLAPVEYAAGFNEGRITDYAYSQATLVPYINYRFMWPNEESQPLVSGNYLISIYDEDNPGRDLLQARVMVNERLADIGVAVTSRTDHDVNGAHQQLEITADPRGLKSCNPFEDLTVTVSQNGTDTRTLRHPLRAGLEGTVVYGHCPELLFGGGKEYRRFETVGLHYPGIHVDRISESTELQTAVLETDRAMAGQPYVYDSTQAGAFVIRAEDASPGEDDTEADYTGVVFTLEMPELQGAEVRVEGLLARSLNPSLCRMAYDSSLGAYRLEILLKQGSYNYRYTADGSPAPIDGDSYRTANRYDVALYHRGPGDRYDRLIGTAAVRAGL